MRGAARRAARAPKNSIAALWAIFSALRGTPPGPLRGPGAIRGLQTQKMLISATISRKLIRPIMQYLRCAEQIGPGNSDSSLFLRLHYHVNN
jgi:hypothetical protein